MLSTHNLDPGINTTRWLARVPRDGGASWDFEDVREHYLTALWDENGRGLRETDPARWRSLSRAITAEIVERTLDEWRRPASTTAGALLWLWRDLWPGAGWGLLDSDGRPKSAFHALRRAALPLRLSITDEGTNGLYLHLVNDSPRAVSGKLVLRCLRHGKTPVIEASREVTVEPHAGLSLGSFELFDRFFDAGHCYRFGPAAHDVVHATFDGAEADQQTEAFHFLAPPASEPDQIIKVALDHDRDGFFLKLHAETTVRFIEITDDHFVPEDNYFHLGSDATRIVRLRPSRSSIAADCPSGHVRALNGSGQSHY
jgi:beta-mannosidase